MSKFLICECCNQTYLEEDMSKNNKNMCCSCWCYTRPKDKRIAELEEQLENAIVPKFKIGQECYTLNVSSVIKCNVFMLHIDEDDIHYDCEFGDGNYRYSVFRNCDCLFATYEEAQAKLEELKGENK